jgi:hypothetical protein
LEMAMEMGLELALELALESVRVLAQNKCRL